MRRRWRGAAVIALAIHLGLIHSAAHAQSTQSPDIVPMTVAEETALRSQIESNWNLGGMAGSPALSGLVVELRVELRPDGTVTKIDVLNDQPDNPEFRKVADSARRAVMISSPLQLPPGKSYSSIRLRFYPDQVVQ